MLAVPDREARLLPHNIDAEQALLGAVLTANDAFWRVSEIVTPEQFYEPLHAKIFELAATMIRAGKIANPITIAGYLPADLRIGEMNRSQYLARLAAEAVTTVGAQDYASVVRDLAARREIIAVAERALAAAYDSPVDATPRAILEEVERSLFAIDEACGRAGARDLVTADQAISSAIDGAAKAYQADGRITGVTWGLRDVDHLTTGLHAGELTILAGRPSMGKSALAVSVAQAAARWTGPEDQTPGGVLLISPEMTAQSVGGRWLSADAAAAGTRVPYCQFRNGRFSDAEFERLTDAAKAAQGMPIYIEESPDISIVGAFSAARRAAMKFKREGRRLALVIVDYLQLLRPEDRYRGRRVDEVSEISAGMKRLARTENVPVLALSQLSRQVEQREDKRPQLSDLRDSGSIEQDADSVVFVYREAYYLQRSEPRSGTPEYVEWQTKLEACHEQLDIIIGKQRHGPIATCTVRYRADTNSVTDWNDTYFLPDGGLFERVA